MVDFDWPTKVPNISVRSIERSYVRLLKPCFAANREAPMGTLVRTVIKFKKDNLTDWAAALTYYSILAMFPALIVLVALLGLLGTANTVTTLLNVVKSLGSSSAVDTVRGPINSVVSNKGGAAALLSAGILGALWAASGYVAAFMRAANTIYEVDRERRIYRKIPVRIGLTLILVVVLAVVALSLVLTGPLAEALGSALGLSGTLVTIWSIAKWPVLGLLVVFIFALLYFAAPNVRHPGFRAVVPGGILALVVWLIASAGFAFYVANFGSYNKTYGSLGGVIVFLVWLYISNNATLLGAAFNAERERTRELKSGQPAREELQMELRDKKGKERG